MTSPTEGTALHARPACWAGGVRSPSRSRCIPDHALSGHALSDHALSGVLYARLRGGASCWFSAQVSAAPSQRGLVWGGSLLTGWALALCPPTPASPPPGHASSAQGQVGPQDALPGPASSCLACRIHRGSTRMRAHTRRRRACARSGVACCPARPSDPCCFVLQSRLPVSKSQPHKKFKERQSGWGL